MTGDYARYEKDPMEEEITDSTLDAINNNRMENWLRNNGIGRMSNDDIYAYNTYRNWAANQVGPWRRFNFSTTGDRLDGSANPLPKPEMPEEIKNNPMIQQMHQDIGNELTSNQPMSYSQWQQNGAMPS